MSVGWLITLGKIPYGAHGMPTREGAVDAWEGIGDTSRGIYDEPEYDCPSSRRSGVRPSRARARGDGEARAGPCLPHRPPPVFAVRHQHVRRHDVGRGFRRARHPRAPPSVPGALPPPGEVPLSLDRRPSSLPRFRTDPRGEERGHPPRLPSRSVRSRHGGNDRSGEEGPDRQQARAVPLQGWAPRLLLLRKPREPRGRRGDGELARGRGGCAKDREVRRKEDVPRPQRGWKFRRSPAGGDTRPRI